MTLSTEHAEKEFTGDGVQTDFDFDFAVIVANPQVDTYVDNVLQVAGVTITPNSNQLTSPGGTAVFSVAPGSGALIVTKRSNPLTQLAAFGLEGKLDTPALEAQLDKQMMISQELKLALEDKAPLIPQVEDDADFTAEVNTFYRVDTSGGDVDVEIPDGDEVGDVIEIQHSVAGNDLTLNSVSGINGQSSVVSTIQYDYFKLTWNGTEWMQT